MEMATLHREEAFLAAYSIVAVGDAELHGSELLEPYVPCLAVRRYVLVRRQLSVRSSWLIGWLHLHSTYPSGPP